VPPKSLVAGVTAVALVAAAAVGIAVPKLRPVANPAIVPVVWQIPMSQSPEPSNQELIDTLNGLAAPGTFGGVKASYVQGGIGRLQSISADNAYNNAVAKGELPMTFSVSNLVQKDDTVKADVTATSAHGHSSTATVTFVAGPSPSGWQLSKSSALVLLSAMS
jgi:hypothetical protein